MGQGEGASVLVDRRSRSPRRAQFSPSRRSRDTPRRRGDSSESYVTTDSDGPDSPVRGNVVDRSTATSGTSVGVSVGGVVGSVGVVGGALTASELALKVIPIINALKAQVAGVSVSLSAIPVLEAAVAEARAGQVDLARKVVDLTQKLTETRASVKLLDGWMVAAEFAQLPRANVGLVGPCFSVSPALLHDKNLGGEVTCFATSQVLAGASCSFSLQELSVAEIDSLLD